MAAPGFALEDHVYYTVQRAAGAETTKNSTDDLATFRDYRDPPLLHDPSMYRGCIERFSVLTKSLPLLVPPIIPDPTNPDNNFNTSWTITLTAQVQANATTALGQLPLPNVLISLLACNPLGGVYNWVPVTVNVSSVDTVATLGSKLQTALGAALPPSTLFPNLQIGVAVLDGRLLITALYGPSAPPTLNLPIALADAENARNVIGFSAQYQALTSDASTSILTMPCRVNYPDAPWTNVSFTRNVQWIPQYTGPEAQIMIKPGTPLFDPCENIAYWMYSYSGMIATLNQTLNAVWQDLCLRVFGGAGGSGTIMPPPYMRFINTTTSFDISAPPMLFGGGSWTPQVFMIFNEPLRLLFSFPALVDSGPGGGNARLDFSQAPLAIETYSPVSTAGEPKQTKSKAVLACDYPPTGNGWSPVSTINFTSQLLGARNEAVSTPSAYGQSSVGLASTAYVGSSSAAIAQITDIYPVSGTPHAAIAEGIYYQPQVRRYFDIQNTAPLRQLDITVYWKHRVTGKLYVLRISPDGSLDIKFQFNALPDIV